jgi:hypothetical protein
VNSLKVIKETMKSTGSDEAEVILDILKEETTIKLTSLQVKKIASAILNPWDRQQIYFSGPAKLKQTWIDFHVNCGIFGALILSATLGLFLMVIAGSPRMILTQSI